MTQEEKKRQNAPQNAGTAESDPAGETEELINQLGERSFSWSPQEDELYKVYADRYRREGSLAMKDSLGQSSALTGGYGSSYAQAAGQQAYDAYLQKLNDAGLQIYDRAYQRYADEGEELKGRIDALQRREDAAREQSNEDRDFDYRAEQDEKDRADTAYNNLYKLILNSGYIPTDEEISSVNMTREAAQALREAYLAGPGSGGASRSGGSSSGRRNDDGSDGGNSGNIYPALLAELRAMSAAGSGGETAGRRINAAFNAGRITQNQRDYLIRNFT